VGVSLKVITPATLTLNVKTRPHRKPADRYSYPFGRELMSFIAPTVVSVSVKGRVLKKNPGAASTAAAEADMSGGTEECAVRTERGANRGGMHRGNSSGGLGRVLSTGPCARHENLGKVPAVRLRQFRNPRVEAISFSFKREQSLPLPLSVIQTMDNCHGGAPVSTSDRRRGQHAGDESLAPLSIRFKTNKANSNELALAA
jgi:hypothetical protein